ncbi:MAG: alpha/beta hydrolase [Mycobacterium sp.]|jgi:cephalosporin-C deacetylase-like acetyl esterase|nr:alpha/beta hydrolase [Mycobacterium sp.]
MLPLVSPPHRPKTGSHPAITMAHGFAGVKEHGLEVDEHRIGLWGSSYAGGHAIVPGATMSRRSSCVRCVRSDCSRNTFESLA